MGESMNWQKIGQWAIRCAPWTISKAVVRGVPVYQLWNDKQPVTEGPIAKADTAAELKKKAEKIGG